MCWYVNLNPFYINGSFVIEQANRQTPQDIIIASFTNISRLNTNLNILPSEYHVLDF